MSSVTIKIEGLHNLLRLEHLRGHYSKAIERSFDQSGKYVVEYIQRQMRSTPISSTGHSLPGGFPAVQSGDLYASVNYTVNGIDGFTVDASTPYAQYLEYGTVRMEARPFLHRGLEESSSKLEQILVNNLRRIFT